MIGAVLHERLIGFASDRMSEVVQEHSGTDVYCAGCAQRIGSLMPGIDPVGVEKATICGIGHQPAAEPFGREAVDVLFLTIGRIT